MIESEIRLNGEKWLAEMAAEEEKARQEQDLSARDTRKVIGSRRLLFLGATTKHASERALHAWWWLQGTVTDASQLLFLCL
jgi:hypothetical protein